MVAGLARRSHTRGLSTSSSSSSSAGWRFPLRAESLSFSKPADHHIVHASTRCEIDRLNGYLRTEARINAGSATHGAPGASLSAAVGHGLLNVGSDLGLAFGSWSMSALPGDQTSRHRRVDSRGPVKTRDIPYILSPAGGSSGATGAAMSPPLSRQASAEHYHCSTAASVDCSAADLLAAQSPPPLYLVSSPQPDAPGMPHCTSTCPATRTIAASATPLATQTARLESLPQTGRWSADACSIIALYSDAETGDSRSKSPPDIDGSTHTSSGSGRSSAAPIDSGCPMGKPQAAATGRPNGSPQDPGRHARCPISAADAGFLDAVSALLPETPRASAGAGFSPRDTGKCMGRHGLSGALPAEADTHAGRELQAAEAQFAARLAAKEQQFERALVAERQKQADELERQRGAAQSQHHSEMSEIWAERDQLWALLEDSLAMSEELVRQSEAERDGLARELGSLTLERQRLQEQLGEARSQVTALENEQQAAQTRMGTLVSDNARLREQYAALRSDVTIAEQRNTQIKEHAQDTLAKANAEISRLQDQAGQAQKNAMELETRVAKAQARGQSLYIQLTSTRQQNTDLLALCEGL